jgi:hypothetical protein
LFSTFNTGEIMSVELRESTLNGRKIAYTSLSSFLIQVGKGPKGSYSTMYQFTGNLGQAVTYYNAVNVGRGYKKRLVFEGAKNPVLARQFSA